MRHADICKRAPAVARFEKLHVQKINRIGILRVGVNAVVIPRALQSARIVADALPIFARVVRAEKSAVFGFDNRPHAVCIDGRNGDSDFAQNARRQTFVARNFRPSVAAVFGFKNSRTRAARIETPRRTADLPESSRKSHSDLTGRKLNRLRRFYYLGKEFSSTFCRRPSCEKRRVLRSCPNR